MLTCMFCALTVLILVIPRTKHIASSILDFPLPFRPVIELKLSSHPLMTVRTAYDLKPSITISTTLITAILGGSDSWGCHGFSGKQTPVVVLISALFIVKPKSPMRSLTTPVSKF